MSLRFDEYEIAKLRDQITKLKAELQAREASEAELKASLETAVSKLQAREASEAEVKASLETTHIQTYKFVNPNWQKDAEELCAELVLHNIPFTPTQLEVVRDTGIVGDCYDVSFVRYTSADRSGLPMIHHALHQIVENHKGSIHLGDDEDKAVITLPGSMWMSDQYMVFYWNK